jgi:hypothetical protein
MTNTIIEKNIILNITKIIRKCSVCNKEGHNKRTCKTINNKELKTYNKEVQSHGFVFEKQILHNVFGATVKELKEIKYNSKNDLPAELNRLGNYDISVKTSGNKNSVCMADCLRVFDSVNSQKPIHIVVVHYQQNDSSNTKKISTITEIDLTNSTVLLFGTLTRLDIEKLDKLVKSVPQKRKPTQDEHKKMYSLRDSLQKLSGAIHLDIKCNSTQSRLQCSFNRFHLFIEKNPNIIVAKSNTNIFRDGLISSEIISHRRCFNKKDCN